MNRSFIVSILLLVPLGMQAQTINNTTTIEEVSRQVQSLNARHAAPSAAKTTAIKQRLVKSSTWSGSAYVDSVLYKYDNGRGSGFDFINMTYQEVTPYPNTEGLQMVMYDSVHRATTTMGTSSISAKYAGTQRIQQIFYGVMSTQRMNWTLNGQGHITEMLTENYNTITTTWLPDYRHIYLYDGAGRLVLDSNETYVLGSWKPGLRVAFHYNSNNQVDTSTSSQYISGQWIANQRYAFAYAGGYMTSSLSQVLNGPNWLDVEELATTYSGNQVIYKKKTRWPGGVPTLESEEHRHLNTAGLPDSIFRHGSNGAYWDTTVTKITYNSFGNPDTIGIHTWTMVKYAETNYWYQDYDPQAVKEIAAAKNIVVYPNPARGQLQVTTIGMKHGSAEYTIVNNLGQTVLKIKKWIDNNKLVIDLPGLSPGTYWLQLQDAAGAWYKAGFVVE